MLLSSWLGLPSIAFWFFDELLHDLSSVSFSCQDR